MCVQGCIIVYGGCIGVYGGDCVSREWIVCMGDALYAWCMDCVYGCMDCVYGGWIVCMVYGNDMGRAPATT